MAQTEHILSIDAGTQSIRVTLIDLKGNITAIVKTSIEPYFSVKAGWAEQEPDYYWKILCETSQKLLNENKELKNSIQAVSLTTQRGTVVNIDKNGKPLRPAILWLDQRMAKVENYPSGLLQTALRVINLREPVVNAVKQAECNWIRQNQSEIWEKTDKFLFLSGWFNYKLSGEFADSIGNMVGYMPFDYKKQYWSKEGEMNAKMFPVPGEKLFDLVKPTELIGHITQKASDETGIPKGLPLIAASADKATEVLGAGCISPEIGCLSYGTTATFETTHNKYIEVIPFFPSYPSALPNGFNTEIMIFRGYWMINWFKKEFGYRETEIAKQKGIAPEQLFDEMISNIPPGSMGLTLQPYWSPGIKLPGSEAKGSIIGFGDVHIRAHIYRAIIEGLAYALKDGMLTTQKRTGIEIEKLRVSGGGSQSKNAMQITADVFGKTTEKPHTYETSALGAAITAAVGMKLYPDFETAIKEMTRISEVYEPIAQNQEIYEKLFNQVYQKMYGKLKPLYNKIRSIINYPEKI